VAGSEMPDLSSDLGFAHRGVLEPTGQTHFRAAFGPSGDFPAPKPAIPRTEVAGAGAFGRACFGLRTSRFDLFWRLAMA
jgi:hypothetical protein